MDITNLTPQERDTLRAQLVAEERAQTDRIEHEREAYKEMVDITVENSIEKLQRLSTQMLQLKQEVFGDFATIIALKNELFRVKGNRQSDTFTTTTGHLRLTLGNRMNEGWDDTVDAGIEIVKEYIKTLARDENSANLVDTVMNLLAKDRKGALKANKVLELEKLAVKAKDDRFLEGINIIKAAYRPVPTCQFIQVEVKDEKGVMQSLPLSLSAM